MRRVLLPIAMLIFPALGWIRQSNAAPAVRAPAARGPASQPTSEAAQERAKWEARIVFFGDEATGEWSLRIRDPDVDTQRQFKLSELWQYDREAKRWVRQGTTVIRATMVTADHKRRDPQNPDDDTQQLAVLPIDRDQVGLYYAKWSVDDVKGSTFCRIGPGLDKKSPLMRQKPPEGKIFVALPIDLKHAEAAFVPDPRIECEFDK
ncbi:MAG TPA: hypothetical protein VLJ39_00440 [Tepidisphaeraceae bacterium]|nr:hypothetical protein [Tepidisphaeraceae bacterium]